MSDVRANRGSLLSIQRLRCVLYPMVYGFCLSVAFLESPSTVFASGEQPEGIMQGRWKDSQPERQQQFQQHESSGRYGSIPITKPGALLEEISPKDRRVHTYGDGPRRQQLEEERRWVEGLQRQEQQLEQQQWQQWQPLWKQQWQQWQPLQQQLQQKPWYQEWRQWEERRQQLHQQLFRLRKQREGVHPLRQQQEQQLDQHMEELKQQSWYPEFEQLWEQSTPQQKEQWVQRIQQRDEQWLQLAEKQRKQWLQLAEQQYKQWIQRMQS
ncbi:hypothetical protein [Pasteuria penetrans]|uniref:hypothetical protein n=1 Tax=Pasteuria penetrans TaxID=86005 RepID=UPI000FBA1EC8|nr:hypothetical protein [Pasteuria penetrans]